MPINQIIAFTFAAAIDGGDFSTQLELRDSSNNLLIGSQLVVADTLYYTSRDALAPNETYRLSLSNNASAVRDVATSNTSFTTRADTATPAGGIEDILFLGNSLTANYALTEPSGFVYYHLDQMYQSQGRGLTESLQIQGGATTQQHFNNEQAIAKIGEGHAITVIQPNTYESVYDTDNFHTYTGLLIDEARNSASVPIVYMVWADGSQPQVISSMSREYGRLASNKNVQLIRVGEVFEYVRANFGLTQFNALLTDSVHTSLAGTWAVSLSMNAFFSGQPAAAVTYQPAGIDSRLASQIRTAVDAVIVDRYAESASSSATVKIASPQFGEFFSDLATIEFIATASDTVDGDVSSNVVWRSSQDGQLGVGASISTDALSINRHTVTATVATNGGENVSAAVDLTVFDNQQSAPMANDFSYPAQPAPTVVQFFPLSLANVSDNKVLLPSGLSVVGSVNNGTISIDAETGRADYRANAGFSGNENIRFRYTDADAEFVEFTGTLVVP